MDLAHSIIQWKLFYEWTNNDVTTETLWFLGTQNWVPEEIIPDNCVIIYHKTGAKEAELQPN